MACHHPALYGSPLPYSWLTQGQQGHSDMSDSREITCLCSCFNCFIRIGVLCAYAANQNLSSQVKNVRRLVNSNMRDLHTFANDTPMVRQKVSIWNTMLHKELGWSIIDGSVMNFMWNSYVNQCAYYFFFLCWNWGFLSCWLCVILSHGKREFSHLLCTQHLQSCFWKDCSHTVKILQQSVSLLWVVFAEETNSNQILKWINEIV